MAPRKRSEAVEKPIPLMVRLPPHLHALVDESARRQHRSLNAQIIHIVSWYFGENSEPVQSKIETAGKGE